MSERCSVISVPNMYAKIVTRSAAQKELQVATVRNDIKRKEDLLSKKKPPDWSKTMTEEYNKTYMTIRTAIVPKRPKMPVKEVRMDTLVKNVMWQNSFTDFDEYVAQLTLHFYQGTVTESDAKEE